MYDKCIAINIYIYMHPFFILEDLKAVSESEREMIYLYPPQKFQGGKCPPQLFSPQIMPLQ